MNELKRKRHYLREESKRFPHSLVAIPKEEWPPAKGPQPMKIWRSRDYLVQLWSESEAFRLSINRTELNSEGGWKDGITWDELQRLKNEAGFSKFALVEIFPAAQDLVEVANIRHLWVPLKTLPFGWHAKPNAQS